MERDLDGRTYDLLWLVDRHEPVGSIRLVELMQRHGYSITGRTIRLTLAELDESGLTEKVPGMGRRLTDVGRAELERGNVSSRLERVRSRIATLTSQVTYDPLEDAGILVASAATIEANDIEEAIATLRALHDTPLGPFPAAIEAVDPGAETDAGDGADRDPIAPDRYRVLIPSSITLDGVFLSHGVDTELRTAGIVEYVPTDGTEAVENPHGTPSEDPEIDAVDRGGTIGRYVDVINGEGSSVDVVSLLIEAGRSNVDPIVSTSDAGLLVVDYREFPLTRFEEARDLAVATRRNLGGVIDVRRPRERGPFPVGPPGWEFGAATYGGTGELVIAALAERGLSVGWETLYGTLGRNRLVSARRLEADDPVTP